MANNTGRGWFQKGHSVNSGGRPKLPRELRILARAEAEQSIRALVALRDGETTPAYLRKAAADTLLRFAWGNGGALQPAGAGE